MLPSLEELLQEFERMSLDSKLHLDFLNQDELNARVKFERCPNGRCWSIWFVDNEKASKQTVSGVHFPAVLRAFGISSSEFEKELGGMLLTQAAYADEFVREVGNLLGVEALQQSILQTQNFMDSVRESMIKVGDDLKMSRNNSENASEHGENSSDYSRVATQAQQQRARFRVLKNT